MKYELIFDVMLNGRFIRTLRMPYCPAFKLRMDEITTYIETKLPTLKGKDYRIEF